MINEDSQKSKHTIEYDDINYDITLELQDFQKKISITINQEDSPIKYEKLNLTLEKLINKCKAFQICESLNDAYNILNEHLNKEKGEIKEINSNRLILLLRFEVLGKEQFLELEFKKEIVDNSINIDEIYKIKANQKKILSKLELTLDTISKLKNELNDIKKTNISPNNLLQEKILSNGDKYIGYIYNNKREGRGRMYYVNGEKYIGEYINDLKDGKGIMYYKNGNKYDGYFMEGKRNGKGIMYYKEGEKYDGDWKDNLFNGIGTYYYNDGRKYIGEFKNDKIEGKGIMYYKNGDKFDGNWKDDKREGKGILYYNNGDRYDGEWVNNKMEGFGRYYFKNGDFEEGKYKGSEKIGVHKKYTIKYEIKDIKY